MHILFTTDSDSRYGAFHALFSLIKALKELDPDIRISVLLPKRSERQKELEKLGCVVHCIPYEPFLQGVPDCKLKRFVKQIVRGLQYLFGKLFALRILEQRMDLHTIDLVHSNSSRDDFGAAIAAKYHKPLIWHIREFGDLDYRCYSYRYSYIDYMNRHAAVFIVVSEAVKQHWIKKGINTSKIICIYDGVDETKFSPDVEHEPNSPMKKDCLRLVMVGALCEGKGQWQIIEAISHLPDTYKKKVRLDIVGDGASNYVKRIKRLVTKLHLEEHIRFLGYRENFSSRLPMYDCGIMCSRCEGFGLVTIEYMMAGLPVLASDTGANPELIQDGVTGFLYHYPDAEDLTKKLIYLSEHKEKAREMGIAAQTVSKEYTSIRNAGKIYQLYKEIAGGKQ